jgi:predicted HicB family RNase H-like nuclease
MVIKSNKKIKSTKFQKLDREHRQLLGRERTLLRMIEKRMEKLNPILYEVKRLRKELEPIEDELQLIKKRIKDVIDNNIFSPKVSIVKKYLYKQKTYYYGRITFSKSYLIKDGKKIENRKEIKVPEKEVEKCILSVKKRNEDYLKRNKSPLYNSEEEFEKQLKIRLEDWVLDWWLDNGIHER